MVFGAAEARVILIDVFKLCIFSVVFYCRFGGLSCRIGGAGITGYVSAGRRRGAVRAGGGTVLSESVSYGEQNRGP